MRILRLAALAWLLVHQGAAAALALDPSSPAGRYVSTSWTAKDGLPGNLIFDIVQDRAGYLWLGTNNGLVRFDGVRFVLWEPLSRPPTPGVNALVAGRDGSLWVASGGGVVTRIQNGQLRSFTAADGVSPGGITALLEDHEGAIWAGTARGLSRYRDGKWERIDALGGASGDAVRAIHEDRLNRIWLATSSGGFVREHEGQPFVRFSTSPLLHDFADGSPGRIWAAAQESGVLEFDAGGGMTSSLSLMPGAQAWRVIEDRDGNRWFATLGGGLIRIRPGQRTYDPRLDHVTRGAGLANDTVRALCEDREGNIWVGTQDGLTRLSENMLSPLIDEQSGQIGQLVRVLTTTPDGSVWVGTNTGLYRFREKRWTRYDERDGLPNQGIRALHRDARGALWVATEGSGLATFADNRFKALPLSGGFNRIAAITIDRRGGIWLSDMDKGIAYWKDATLTASSLPRDLESAVAMSAYTDSADRVWFGLNDGRVAFGTSERFRVLTRDDGLQGAGVVGALLEDRHGAIWTGANGGLARFKDGRVDTLTGASGFPVSNISSICEDDEGDLWVGVRSGLVRFSPAEFDKAVANPTYQVRYRIYDPWDGLPGSPIWFGFPTATKGTDGRLWFVTSNGLAVLDPRRVDRERLPTTVRIEAVAADGMNVELDGGGRLPPNTSRVQFDYTALKLTAPTRVRFRYRLEGFDQDWVDADNRRQAFYTNLAPGPYRFQVVANDGGVWSDQAAAWEFSIAPAFYQTRAFSASVVLAVLLSLGTAWLVRGRQLRAQFAAVLAERARVGREIHDTLLQSLAGVAIQFTDIRKKIGTSPEAARTQLEHLRHLVEESVREARQSIQDLRSPSLEARDLPGVLREATADQVADLPLRLDFAVEGQPHPIARRTEEHLLRICAEAVSNAIRHADARRVEVTLAYHPGSVVLRVADDGRGFDPAGLAPHSTAHYGLVGIRERAQETGGRLRLTSEPGRGTVIEVTVPVQRAVSDA